MKNCPFEKEKNIKKRYTKLLFGPANHQKSRFKVKTYVGEKASSF